MRPSCKIQGKSAWKEPGRRIRAPSSWRATAGKACRRGGASGSRAGEARAAFAVGFGGQGEPPTFALRGSVGKRGRLRAPGHRGALRRAPPKPSAKAGTERVFGNVGELDTRYRNPRVTL